MHTIQEQPSANVSYCYKKVGGGNIFNRGGHRRLHVGVEFKLGLKIQVNPKFKVRPKRFPKEKGTPKWAREAGCAILIAVQRVHWHEQKVKAGPRAGQNLGRTGKVHDRDGIWTYFRREQYHFGPSGKWHSRSLKSKQVRTLEPESKSRAIMSVLGQYFNDLFPFVYSHHLFNKGEPGSLES